MADTPSAQSERQMTTSEWIAHVDLLRESNDMLARGRWHGYTAAPFGKAPPDKWRALLERDLHEELQLAARMTGTLGDRCDHDAWTSLAAWMAQERDDEKALTS